MPPRQEGPPWCRRGAGSPPAQEVGGGEAWAQTVARVGVRVMAHGRTPAGMTCRRLRERRLVQRDEDAVDQEDGCSARVPRLVDGHLVDREVDDVQHVPEVLDAWMDTW